MGIKEFLLSHKNYPVKFPGLCSFWESRTADITAKIEDFIHFDEFGNVIRYHGVFIWNVTCVCVMYIFSLTGLASFKDYGLWKEFVAV